MTVDVDPVAHARIDGLENRLDRIFFPMLLEVRGDVKKMVYASLGVLMALAGWLGVQIYDRVLIGPAQASAHVIEHKLPAEK